MTLLSDDQREWVHLKLAMLKVKPHREVTHKQIFNFQFKLSKTPYRVTLRRITEHKKFEIFITTCVLLNMIVFALNWSRQDQSLSEGLCKLILNS
jgi:hypothetical protein